MRTEITVKYIAYDGVVFNNEQECFEHEKYALDMINEFVDCCTFYQNGKDVLYVPNIQNVEILFDWLSWVIFNCDTIVVSREIPSSASAFVGSEFSPDFCNFDIGTYVWNMDKMVWVRID